MERRDAVLDASFWINAERCGLTSHLLDYFHLVVPPLVAQELAVRPEVPTEPPPAAALFSAWHQRGDVEILSPAASYSRFDAGENQAIALAQERGWVLLIDDAAARHYSRGPLHLRVVDSPAFAVFLYDQGRLSYAQAVAALRQSQAGRRIINEALVALELLARRKEER